MGLDGRGPSQILQPQSLSSSQYCFLLAYGCTTHKGAAEHQEFSIRERSYRTLLTHEYEATKCKHIFPAQVSLMKRHPGAPFLTLFDYTRGGVRIEVQLVSDSSVVRSFDPESSWPNEVVRAARAGGRTELHVMEVLVKRRTRYFVVSLNPNGVVPRVRWSGSYRREDDLNA